MTALDIFALIVLLVLLRAVIGIWVILELIPGRIAKARNHPQAEAIGVCRWQRVITMGILCPLAFVWAYTKPRAGNDTASETTAPTNGPPSAEEITK